MSRFSIAPISWPVRRSLLWSVLLGGLIGLFLRLGAGQKVLGLGTPGLWIMTCAFVMVGPFAIGYITVYAAERSAPRSRATWVFAPWLAVLVAAAMTYLLNLEGLICIVFLLPIAFLFSTVGGVAGGTVARRSRARRALSTACVALIPLLLAPLESRMDSPVQYRTVATQVRVHASAATVWKNIERVRAIDPGELPPTWAHRIGFPRPVEATLSYEGNGAVRHASFEHGLMFIETVNLWEPERALAFSIKADTADIPNTTLDDHVTVGGRYFDVLEGEYRLEPLENGEVLLHLSSKQRLSTDFNTYAGLWSDAVMGTLQSSILQVVTRRCEKGS